MKRLLIIGAGAAGREILSWLKNIDTKEWEIGGFLDDNLHALDSYSCSHKIIGGVSNYTPDINDVFICGIFSPRVKLELCRKLQSQGAKFITAIHPSAVISEDCKIGVGCVVYPHVYIAAHAVLGDFVCLNVSASVGHDAVLGDGCTLSGHCDITGNVKLSEGVFMGTHAAIIPNIHVGEYAKIGAGSVVFKNVKPNITIMGIPARQLC